MNTILKQYIYISLTISSLSYASVLQDEKELMQRSAPIDVILPPEGMKLIQEQRFLIHQFPHITLTSKPEIQSFEDYKIAKSFISITKQTFLIYDYVSTKLGHSEQGLAMFHDNLKSITGLCGYVDHLLNYCFPTVIRDAEEKDDLRRIYYELKVEQGVALLKLVLACPDSFSKQKYADQFRALKQSLKPFPPYLRQLKESTGILLENYPGLSSIIAPSINSKPIIKEKDKKVSHRRKKLQDIRIQNNILGLNKYFTPDILEEDFDLFFHGKIRELLNEANIVSLNKDIEEAVSGYQSIAKAFLELEKNTFDFMKKLGCKEVPSITINLKDVVQVYHFIQERYIRANPQNAALLGNIVILFLYAGMPQEALTRAEAMRFILLQDSKGSLPKSFSHFYAKILALNGDVSEWQMLEKAKQKQRQRKKAAIQRKRKAAIETQQREVAEKAKVVEDEKSEDSTSITYQPKTAVDLSADYEQTDRCQVSGKKDLVIPKQRIKTRPAKIDEGGKKETTQSPLIDQGLNSSATLSKTRAEIPQYYLSRNSYNTCLQFLQGQWKSTRNALYNLFSELGCTVDEREGKGVHGKISFGREVVLKKAGNIVTVLPDLSQTPLENKQQESKEIPMLTVPDWEHKWSGIIPPYFAKNILKAFAYLGVQQETVFKKNERRKG